MGLGVMLLPQQTLGPFFKEIMDVVDCMLGGKNKRNSAKPKVAPLEPNRIWYCANADGLYIWGSKKPPQGANGCCTFIGFL